MSLRRHEGETVFVQLGRVPNFTHVRYLHGDLVGCALKDETGVPHLVNWRTSEVYALGEFPDIQVRIF